MAKDKTPKKAPSSEKKEIPGESTNKKVRLPEDVSHILGDSLKEFNKFTDEERKDLYGDRKLRDQLWEHFKKKNPDLLSQLKKEDLPAYLALLENR
jgi:hypothetical protein